MSAYASAKDTTNNLNARPKISAYVWPIRLPNIPSRNSVCRSRRRVNMVVMVVVWCATAREWGI